MNISKLGWIVAALLLTVLGSLVGGVTAQAIGNESRDDQVHVASAQQEAQIEEQLVLFANNNTGLGGGHPPSEFWVKDDARITIDSAFYPAADVFLEFNAYYSNQPTTFICVRLAEEGGSHTPDSEVCTAPGHDGPVILRSAQFNLLVGERTYFVEAKAVNSDCERTSACSVSPISARLILRMPAPPSTVGGFSLGGLRPLDASSDDAMADIILGAVAGAITTLAMGSAAWLVLRRRTR